MPIQEGPNNNIDCICCNAPMKELQIKTSDDLFEEKHVPIVRTCCNKVMVQVGKEMHPHTKAHYIEWIMLVTNKGRYIKYLNYEDDPKAFFILCKKETPKVVYAYCNIHELYGVKVK